MSPNEFLITLIVIIAGLAIVDMVASLHLLFTASKRVRWDWLALTAAAAVAYNLLLGCWSLWITVGGDTAISQPLGSFIINVAANVCYYLSCRAVLPDEAPTQGVDLAAHYKSVSRYVWTAQALSMAIAMVGLIATSFIEGMGDPSRLVFGAAGILLNLVWFAVLAFFRQRAVHRILVPMHLVLTFALTAGLRL